MRTLIRSLLAILAIAAQLFAQDIPSTSWSRDFLRSDSTASALFSLGLTGQLVTNNVTYWGSTNLVSASSGSAATTVLFGYGMKFTNTMGASFNILRWPSFFTITNVYHPQVVVNVVVATVDDAVEGTRPNTDTPIAVGTVTLATSGTGFLPAFDVKLTDPNTGAYKTVTTNMLGNVWFIGYCTVLTNGADASTKCGYSGGQPESHLKFKVAGPADAKQWYPNVAGDMSKNRWTLASNNYYWCAPTFLYSEETTLSQVSVSLTLDPTELLAVSNRVTSLESTRTTFYPSSQTLTTLAPTHYGQVGRENMLYWDGIVQRGSDYHWTVSGLSGTNYVQFEEGIFSTPGSVGTNTVTVNGYYPRQAGEDPAITGTTVWKAVESTTSWTNTLLVIGDSTTAGGAMTGELLTIMSSKHPTNWLTLIGTQGSGTNLHEGVSGKTYAYFASNAASPFVTNGVFSFNYYLTNNSFATPTHVLFLLGINDVFNATSDSAADAIIATELSHLSTMISSIHAASADIKIGIGLTAPGFMNQDAFGANYGTADPWWRAKRNMLRLYAATIAAHSSQESSKIFLVPVNDCVDTYYGYPRSSGARNTRLSDTVSRGNNGVHWNSGNGYLQVADTVYSWMTVER